ncbi:hypothetical protein [Streptomyces sp. 3N207]|uniref:hypothetical protein n=1 Tax=Streptomyces sp. 3N207 TaxID=3457417 RepID=UPI003FD585EA
MCAAAAVAAAVVLPVIVFGSSGAPPSSQPADQAKLQQLLDEQRARRVAVEKSAREARAAARAQAAERLKALRDALKAPGARARMAEGAVEVVFDKGLFSRADTLTPLGASRINALGKELTGRDVRVSIHGHAATVPGAPSHGGSVTSLWRALIVARELSAVSGRPLTAFTVASADQSTAPHRTDAANRTVTITVTPA